VRERLMGSRNVLSRWLVLASWVLAAGAFADKPPEVSHDGLQLVPDTKLQLVYIKPGVDFSIYKRIALIDCAVAFKKNWQRNRTRPTRSASARKTWMRFAPSLPCLPRNHDRRAREESGGMPMTDTADDDVSDPAAGDHRSRRHCAGRGRHESGTQPYVCDERGLHDALHGVFTTARQARFVARIADHSQAREDVRMMWQNS
jgi:hypothetical protein